MRPPAESTVGLPPFVSTVDTGSDLGFVPVRPNKNKKKIFLHNHLYIKVPIAKTDRKLQDQPKSYAKCKTNRGQEVALSSVGSLSLPVLGRSRQIGIVSKDLNPIFLVSVSMFVKKFISTEKLTDK